MGAAPLPPHDLAAEENLLGACLLSPSAADAVAELVRPQDLYRASHGAILAACLELRAAGEPTDAIAVVDRLRAAGRLDAAGGEGRVHELATIVPAASNAPHYARIVAEKAAFRSLIRAGSEIARLGYEQEGEARAAVERSERLVFELGQSRRRGDFVPLSELAAPTFERLQTAAASGRDVLGLPTGFPTVDRMTSGLQPGNLILLAARPSLGKTAYSLSVAAHVVLRADPPVPVALFTLEMSRAEVMDRLVSAEALVDSDRVRTPSRLQAEDWSRVVAAIGRLAEAPLLIDDSGAPTLGEVRSKARRLKASRPDLGLIVLDYVQLLSSGERAESRNAELAQISRSLKLLAGELQVPVLVLSQLSREVERRHDKRPQLSDLRDSGSLEADADAVFLLYRDEYYFPEDAEENGTAGVAELNVAKQRNGPTGTRKLGFQGRFVRFTELAT
jgi:replicative DNA helicase